MRIAVDHPVRPGLRMESADGGRLVLVQGERPVLFARQRVTHHGVHYARTGTYVSPLAPVRAATARAFADFAPPGSEAWTDRWAAHAREELCGAAEGPLHAGDWHLAPMTSDWFVESHWAKLLPHDTDRGHLTWFGYGDPDEDARDLLPLRALSAPDAPRVKAYRRQYREGLLPPVVLWWISGLQSPVVLDGHDRLVAALAEGGRPTVLLLSGAVDAGHVAMWSELPLRAYEERMAALRPGPLAGVKASTVSRQLAAELLAVERAPRITRAWPLAGGVAAWERATTEHVPGWRPKRRP
ncbi:hypothetical protein RGF97_04410 [Streptomyces roseicoloratus]|uniref:Uncharacterized protein n=1 Tax=Streptomyces roseicoloratus TaxID=2508722 RepID=A0ABY9RTI1_9ACTN|nr:hypothetical protein [Streptomyces roseicoloratus]WMX44250.1 hypothetical protein RGF97_04410 [Streptomyces roseicoloratus]